MRGLPENTNIWLKGSEERNKIISKVYYDTKYVTPKGAEKHEKDLNGEVVENWTGQRLIIKLDMMLQKQKDTEIDTKFLLFDFKINKNRQYKEDSWDGYIDVYIDDSSLKLHKDSIHFGDVQMTLKSKQVYSAIESDTHSVDYMMTESGEILQTEDGENIIKEG